MGRNWKLKGSAILDPMAREGLSGVVGAGGLGAETFRDLGRRGRAGCGRSAQLRLRRGERVGGAWSALTERESGGGSSGPRWPYGLGKSPSRILGIICCELSGVWCKSWKEKTIELRVETERLLRGFLEVSNLVHVSVIKKKKNNLIASHTRANA